MIMCSWNFNLNYILPLRPYNLKVLGHKYPYKISLKYLVTFCAILQVIIFDVRSAVTTPEVLGYFCSNIRTHWFDQTGSNKFPILNRDADSVKGETLTDSGDVMTAKYFGKQYSVLNNGRDEAWWGNYSNDTKEIVGSILWCQSYFMTSRVFVNVKQG